MFYMNISVGRFFWINIVISVLTLSIVMSVYLNYVLSHPVVDKTREMYSDNDVSIINDECNGRYHFVLKGDASSSFVVDYEAGNTIRMSQNLRYISLDMYDTGSIKSFFHYLEHDRYVAYTSSNNTWVCGKKTCPKWVR